MLYAGLFFFLAVGPIFALCKNDPIVNITLGAILGTIQTSRNGSEFYSFRGIQYAKSPTGELRFKPPVPVEPWNGLYNASTDGPMCWQPRFTGHSEDCLCLNVYTRGINDVQNKRPVLFYIHGGSYAHWSSHSKLRGPDYLMDHDIVLVTINYRLGTFGFFSTGDKYAPGNYGMKDQVEALKWVHRHISSFGGDPNKITIAGESAGAASVSLHLLSPMSRGLFHRAIIVSGSPISLWSIVTEPRTLAKKQASLLNCSVDSFEIMMDCMRKVPANSVINTYGGLLEWHQEGIFHAPVVETDVTTERFLTKDPLMSLLEGDTADVPILIGTTRDEMIGRAFRIVDHRDWAEDLSLNWNRVAPIISFYKPNDTASERLRDFYLGNLSKPITTESMAKLGQLISDGVIIFGAIRTTKLLAEENTKPVYLYQFNYMGDYSILNWPDTYDPIGVAHGDDLFYIFYESYFNPKFNTTSKEGQMVSKLTFLWKNFIETGNPTPESSEVLDNVIWKAYTNEKPKYLDIGENLTMVDGLYYKDRMELWESLFPLP